MFPTLEEFKPFVITGLALGGVYALSGVGIVVLYRTTGVLNLAFGAIGAMGALISWTLINHTSIPALGRVPRLHRVRGARDVRLRRAVSGPRSRGATRWSRRSARWAWR